jgi:ubiquinone biosynthesis protein
MASLPRRESITIEPQTITPPMMQSTTYAIDFMAVLRNIFKWLLAGIAILAGNAWDWLGRKNSEARRAARVRRIFENRGGTFKKIGQLLAMRIDILPWVYCVELSHIIDQMPPFSTEQAIQIITSSTKKALKDTFNQFDPEPILSTSIACSYQAILKNGTKVAVKVRRPGSGEAFMADLKALEWILNSMEFLSFLRPGFTQNLQRELRETIQDELNFILEARHQSLFRKEAKKSGKKFFTSPKIFFDLSSQSVIIQEFTTGMWLWELLAAVEQNNPEAQERAKLLNIDPALVARRLLWVNFWGLDEHMLFRTNLHPNNLIIRKNSKLTFIDFSSIGALTQEKRQAIQQTMLNAWKKDPLEMAQESMVLLEPLPPIDTIEFTKDLETAYWQYLYALESKHVQWWERTSARLWLGFVRVAREHHVTMNIHVLRMIRSCLLHDAIAARLSQRIDHAKEYQRFSKHRANAARKRMVERVQQQLEQGLDNRIYLQFEEITDTTERLYRQLQRFLSTPLLKFNAVLGKSVYSMSIFFRLAGQFVIMVLIGLGIVYGFEGLANQQPPLFSNAIGQVFSNRIFQFGIIFLLMINIRSMLFRLGDKDV